MAAGFVRGAGQGEMSYAMRAGVVVVRLCGDIRFGQCAALDRFLRQSSAQPYLVFIFDLSDASALDSTALGVIAQIAVHSRRHQRPAPIVLCQHPDLLAVLRAVSFDRAFTLLNDASHYPVVSSQHVSSENSLPKHDMPAANTVREATGDSVAAALEVFRQMMAEVREGQASPFRDIGAMTETVLLP